MRMARHVTLLTLGVLFHLPALARPVCADDLRLSEFLAGPATDWDGSGVFSSRDDEWIEVQNPGATEITLDGWYLTDADSVPRVALTGTLAPGAVRVVFGSQAADWQRATGRAVVGLSLANSGDEVLLWHAGAGDSTVVDRYAYRSHEAAADRAVGRTPDGTAWVLYDQLNPYTGSLPPGSSGCAPTPARSNTCDTTPTARTSWGRLKDRYR